MPDIVFDRREDHPGKFGPQHPCRHPEVPADMVWIDMSLKEGVRTLIGMVMVNNNNGDTIDLGHAVRWFIFLRRTVVHHEDERKFLPVADEILQRKIKVTGNILNFIKRCL